MADLRKALERTRAGYAAELDFHRFLDDAHTGGGGFNGGIAIPESQMGSARSVFRTTPTSYIDAHPREDEKKFDRRKAIAHYTNYVSPLTDLKISFLLKKPFVPQNLPDAVKAWREDVDGNGTHFDLMRGRAALRAAKFGWFPSVVDMPPKPQGVETKAQADNAGMRPRLTLLYPGNLTEWDTHEGQLRWAKIRTDFCERQDWMADDPTEFSVFDLWTPDSFSKFRIVKSKTGDAVETVVENQQHSFGRIPLAICRHVEAEDDPIFGIPMHGAIAIESKRLFNLGSELDENLRGHAFPILVLARDLAQKYVESDQPVVIGAGNGLELDQNATQKHYFLGPPADIAASLETRIENTVREIYRMARTEHVRPAGVADATGIARKYAFAATNAAISAFAANLARWETEVLRLVAIAEGITDADTINAIWVQPPDDFDVADLDASIKQALDSLTADLGHTASKKIRMQLASEVLPDLSDEERATIEEELDEAETERKRAAAFTQAALDAANNADPGMMDNGDTGAAGGPNRPSDSATGAA